MEVCNRDDNAYNFIVQDDAHCGGLISKRARLVQVITMQSELMQSEIMSLYDQLTEQTRRG